MKAQFLTVILCLNPYWAKADYRVCGRFADPTSSILKSSQENIFDFNKISKVNSENAYCFHNESANIRCDISYNKKMYSYFFNTLDAGTVERSFVTWLKGQTGKKAVIKFYNTLYTIDNDIEGVDCSNWYEEMTSTLTIDGIESKIL